MKELAMREMEVVNGGVINSLFGVTEIEEGLAFGAAAGFVAGAALGGWKAGTYISDNWLSQSTKDAIGGTVAGMVNEVRSFF